MPDPGYVPPEINAPRHGALLIVGRDPGEQEVEQGRPFVGKAGALLDIVLSEAGLRRSECNLANVVGYQPDFNEFKNHTPEHVEEGVCRLRDLAKQLRPSLIITLGNEASYALIEQSAQGYPWPTSGRGIYGAKSIEDRRGYFWDTERGTVLTTLHPAGVLRKAVPGDYLLRVDIRRARRFLRGKLPRDTFPTIQRLNGPAQVKQILSSSLIGWDIETKWDMTSTLCVGFCGDDLQPYVALCPHEFPLARAILEGGKPNAGHNRLFDDVAMELFEGVVVTGEKHDTQQMWHALEPELAGKDEETAESVEGTKRSRMTRKGLAFLASIYMNCIWWKDYPVGRNDPESIQEMVVLNGRDAWVTRRLAGWMLQELDVEGVREQYDKGIATYPALIRMAQRGLHVNEELRQDRLNALQTRHVDARATSEAVGLPYVVQNDLSAFRALRRCECCGGGKVSAQHCWKCGGLPVKPTRKPDWPEAYIAQVAAALEVSKPTVGDLKKSLPTCSTCEGKGKIKTYAFNPYSEKQLKQLLHNDLAAPKHTYKGKTVTDAAALKKILKWAKGA